MTDDDKELVRDLRVDADQCFTKCDPTKKWCKCAFYTRIADRIEALSAENERLREALENISMRLPDECHMVSDIAFAALGDTFEDLGQDFEAVWDANRDKLYEGNTK